MSQLIKIYCLLFLALFVVGVNKSILSQVASAGEFVENKGQVIDVAGKLRPDILYAGDVGGIRVYLRKGAISYVLTKQVGVEEMEELEEEIEHMPLGRDTERIKRIKKKKQEELNSLKALAKLTSHRVDMEFIDVNENVRVTGELRSQGYLNYFLAHCPQGILGVKSYHKVIYEQLYPNIDVVFYAAKKGGLEYDFVIQPGGRVEDIKISYKGVDRLSVEQGRLKIITSIGIIREEMPEVFQVIDGEKVKVTAKFILSKKGEENEVKLSVHEYDKSQDLIIDPWVTYYGGSLNDYGQGLTLDGNSNVLITGRTTSTNFPTLGSPPFQASHSSGFDAFIVKFDSAGTRLWATYYGGSGSDNGHAIATDGSDNVIITGSTSSTNFPVSANAVQGTAGGGTYDAFVVRFDSAGTRLWATYYGGSASDYGGRGVDTDSDDNVLITGYTASTDLPSTSGNYQPTHGGSTYDAFVVKFDSAGNYIWATYLGGTSSDYGHSITIDGSDNVIVTGRGAPNFPLSSNPFQSTYGGGTYDAFIVKYDSAGSRLWSTYYGGSSNDYPNGITTDPSDNILLTGRTASTNFPVSSAPFQDTHGGGIWDAFVLKFSASGSRLWGTYLGGSGKEEGIGIIVDPASQIYVTGDTYSTSFSGITTGSFQDTHGGGLEDNYLIRFDSNGDRICGTYLGGSGHDEGWNEAANIMAVHDGKVYITGYTPGSYPTTSGAFQTAYGGGSADMWIAQLCVDCNVDCTPVTVALAVELLSFTGQAINNEHVRLEWKTISEINTDYFEILRSTDGKAFIAINKQQAAANSNTLKSYSYLDKEPPVFNKSIYYRLKQVDFDGTSQIETIQVALTAAVDLINIYPTLLEKGSLLHIEYNNQSGANISIHIIDVIGRSVYSKDEISEKGLQKIQLNTDALKADIYFVHVSVGNTSTMKKITIVE